MAVCWVKCPVALEGDTRKPKAATINDPGKPYQVTTVNGKSIKMDLYSAINTAYGKGTEKDYEEIITAITGENLATSEASFSNPTPIQATLYKRLNHSSVITDKNYCISRVAGADLSLMHADADCIELVGDDEDLNSNAAASIKPGSDLVKIKAEMDKDGIDRTKLKDDDPFYKWIVKYGQDVRPDFSDTRGTWTKE